MTALEFAQKNPNYSLLTQIIYPRSNGFQTKVCFHNYYERVLKRPVFCELFYFVFDQNGNQIEQNQVKVESDCAVQVDVSKAIVSGLGTVAVAVIPDFDLNELEAQGLVPRRPQAAGYYILWENSQKGLIDSSHEWAPADLKGLGENKFYVHLPADPYLNQRSIVVYNPSLSETVDVQIVEKKSRNEERLRLNPMAVQEIHSKASATDDADFVVHGKVVAPFSVEYHVQGDLHIHHS